MRVAIIAAVVAVIVAVPTTVAATHLFADVPDDHTHAEGINYAVQSGITQGCDDETYCPEEPVTRGQMATFLHRQSGNGDVPPTVNADTLQGMTPGDLSSSIEQVVVTKTGSGVIECPEGTFVVGGGFLHNGQEQHEVFGSHPVAESNGFNTEGWYIGVNQNGSTGSPIGWAVCLRVG